MQIETDIHRHTEAHRGTQRHTEAHRGTQRHPEAQRQRQRPRPRTRPRPRPRHPRSVIARKDPRATKETDQGSWSTNGAAFHRKTAGARLEAVFAVYSHISPATSLPAALADAYT
eukprot:1597225-Rhodomonas_salina.1